MSLVLARTKSRFPFEDASARIALSVHGSWNWGAAKQTAGRRFRTLSNVPPLTRRFLPTRSTPIVIEMSDLRRYYARRGRTPLRSTLEAAAAKGGVSCRSNYTRSVALAL
jgi:hypothetical protein